MIIDPDTMLYGVVGNPLTHTLSPALHNAAFAVLGLNALYLAFETRDIEGAMTGMRALGLKGLSVTRPFKSEVIPWLDEVEEQAGQIGAVNTVVNQGGRLTGFNTDADGALQANGSYLTKLKETHPACQGDLLFKGEYSRAAERGPVFSCSAACGGP